MAENTGESGVESGTWAFLTSHAHVLICSQEDRAIRTRSTADRVGIRGVSYTHLFGPLGLTPGDVRRKIILKSFRRRAPGTPDVLGEAFSPEKGL
jgi:hypothetical protein